MSADEPLKSAYELAMDRLRAQDKDDGIEEAKPLTEEQKAEITRLRSEATAKLAEMEILQRKDLASVGGDPAKLLDLREKHRVDRERVAARLESAIARVRAGKPARRDE